MSKNILYSGLIAMLVSIMTIGTFKVLDKSENGITIEHVNKTPSSSAVYTLDENDKIVPLDFTKTAEKVIDAVVHIKSTQLSSASQQYGFQEQQIPEPFRHFFRMPQNGTPLQPQARVGTGSGVIVGSDGYIMTNNHVIDNAQDIEVALHDNRTYKAVLIGTDPTTDLALLRIKEENLPTIPFINSDEIKIGEWVMAVGNPYSLNSTITAGIVSAKGRNINILKEKYAVEDFIQTDAAINPGNSGGALVNLDGGLVGINTAIASPTGSYSGYGFAVPANIVIKVMEDLMRYGAVQRGVLGVMIRDLDGNLAKEKQIDLLKGVYIDTLMENSAAEEAGLKPGDVIVKVDNTEINSSPELQGMIARHRPGEKVRVTVNRKGSEKEFDVLLRDSKGGTEIVSKENVEVLKVLGIDLKEVDEGIKVEKIYPGKIGRETQMRDGFIIQEVDGKKIKSKKELIKIFESKKGGVMLSGIYKDIPGEYFYAFGL
ncbi:Do family serine endopeptidase [Portibacter lacus]|uniref:Serine protease n=1 Tax=Portibacter lacus TaxID=1099794 RepID=A0AA37SN29_9BACT|nr:Do family serine endopeptidase [Portibacter lacus]GLR16044.1 serine protease [Portibacter lacus]